MNRARGSTSEERYALEHGDYVLWRAGARVLVTPAVAVLIDTRRGVLVTHGDPASVRHELDEMRRLSARSGLARHDQDLLLLEGRPNLPWLNEGLRDAGDFLVLGAAFTGGGALEALQITRALLARLARRP